MSEEAVHCFQGASSARREFSSFRDPAGFMFWHEGTIYRWVSGSQDAAFRKAFESGLYREAMASGKLLSFEIYEGESFGGLIEASGTILKPRQIGLITYPYEWSFSQLQDAAIATLDLHILALSHGMLLKDASAFNMQFVDGAPRLIDHLSFDSIEAHGAWPAYGQFCRHFLAPLLLMSHVDLSMGRLLQLYIDGIPLDLASKLLPVRTRFSSAVQLHLHLHAKMLNKFANKRKKIEPGKKALSVDGLRAFANSLRKLVSVLKPVTQVTEWGEYYSDTNYSEEALNSKKHILRQFVERAAPRKLLDLGGNNGEMTRAVLDLTEQSICADIDPRAVDANYRVCKRDNTRMLLPLLADVSNPAPAIGFDNKERLSLFDRLRPDLIMALALIHHLSISNNLPLEYVARFFAEKAKTLIIEFVPKSDSQVRRLLTNREDIFPDYTESGFVAAFSQVFDIAQTQRISGSERTLFLMMRKES